MAFQYDHSANFGRVRVKKYAVKPMSNAQVMLRTLREIKRTKRMAMLEQAYELGNQRLIWALKAQQTS